MAFLTQHYKVSNGLCPDLVCTEDLFCTHSASLEAERLPLSLINSEILAVPGFPILTSDFLSRWQKVLPRNELFREHAASFLFWVNLSEERYKWVPTLVLARALSIFP